MARFRVDPQRLWVAVVAAGWLLWMAYLVVGKAEKPPDPLAAGLLGMLLLVATGRWYPWWGTVPIMLAVTTLFTQRTGGLGVMPVSVVGALAFVGFSLAGVTGGLFRDVARSDDRLGRTLDRYHDLDTVQRELRDILDAVPSGIVVFEGGTVRQYNEGATTLLDCDGDGVTAHAEPILAALDGVLPSHRVVTVTTRVGERTLECSAVALGDDKAVVVFADQTDVRRQNEELRRQRAALAEQRVRWETLLERVDHCYFRVEDGRPEFSRSAPKVLVTSLEALEADPWSWMHKVQGSDRDRVRKAIAAARGGVASQFEFLCGEAGSAHWVRMALRPVLDGEMVVAVEGHGQDITPEVTYRIQTEALRRKEDKLQQLEEMDRFKTQFMHTIAHELSTPLTPLKMQVDMMAEAAGERADDEQRDGFRLVQRNLLRLEALVKDMLDASRIQTGRLQVHPADMDLAAVVRDVCTSFQAQARAAGIGLEVETPGAASVHGDEARLAQVLYNLLSNAVKFTPAGGEVRVRLTPGDPTELRVTDTGLGLTHEQQGKLFVPFNQFHRDQVGAHVGTGMGLYICRGIIDAHGGDVSCHSDGPGQGTTFTVRLPAAGPEEHGGTQRPPRPGRRPGQTAPDRPVPNRLSTPHRSAASRTGP